MPPPTPWAAARRQLGLHALQLPPPLSRCLQPPLSPCCPSALSTPRTEGPPFGHPASLWPPSVHILQPPRPEPQTPTADLVHPAPHTRLGLSPCIPLLGTAATPPGPGPGPSQPPRRLDSMPSRWQEMFAAECIRPQQAPGPMWRTAWSWLPAVWRAWGRGHARTLPCSGPCHPDPRGAQMSAHASPGWAVGRWPHIHGLLAVTRLPWYRTCLRGSKH